MNINESKHNSDNLQSYESIHEDKHLHLIEDKTPSLKARMQNGKRLIIFGFVIAIFGIIVYCIPTASMDFGQYNNIVLNGGLLVIGIGVLCWLIGAIKYLNAAIDSNIIDDSF